ncbi:MAG TPA: SLC13 family permease [Lacunisphaera sp.]|nr:SLC13 family permease [Lacunisphaera sp.]
MLNSVTFPMWLVVAVIVATFVAIITEAMRAELAALSGCCVLLALRVLSAHDLFPVFGNEAIITVGSMFVLSAALERTGVIASASRLLRTLPVRNERFVLLLLLPPVVAVSAFVNNTPVVVVFLPILVTLARRQGLAASKLLMPLSFASIFGGSMTLIGTSTNLVASSAGQRLGLAPLGMFEMAPVGLLLGAVGLAVLFIFAPRLLPRRETVTSLLDAPSDREFLTEAFVPVGSALIGRTARDALGRVLGRDSVLELVRHGEACEADPGNIPLEAGDRLRVMLDAESVAALKERRGLALATVGAADLALGETEPTRRIESIVAPQSALIGHTLAQADLRGRFGVIVLALHRRGHNLRDRIGDVPLQAGDVLLLEASDGAMARLRPSDDLLVLAGGQQTARRHKRWIAAAVIAAVVAVSALQLLPIAIASLIGVVIVITARCIDADEAYHAIDWPTLFLIAGMLALSAALEKTGAAEAIATAFVGLVSPLGPWISLSLIILAASTLTNFLSNNAVAALLVPLAVETALLLGVDPRPFLIGVAFGASACFATPIGYQTNTLVYGAGGYRFRDFLRLGLPINLLHWLLASVLVPLFWPF